MLTNSSSRPVEWVRGKVSKWVGWPLACVAMIFAATPNAFSQEISSVVLTDVIKSQGTGNIDLFKDVTAQQLEALRLDNGGALVFAVDINEDASGSEKASSQGVAIKSVTLTVDYDDGSQLLLSSTEG